MISILDRYIATTMLKATSMTVLVLVILLVFFGFVDEMDSLNRGNYQVVDAFVVALLSSPRYIFEVFPIAALLGSLVGLGGLAAHSELIAMRAAGLSLRDIIMAVMKAGLLMMLVVFIFGELVAPIAEQTAQQIRAEKQQGQITLKTRYGFWARDGAAFINIRKISSGSRLEDIYIYEFDDNKQLKLATHADYADYQGDHWLLHDISQSQIDKTGVEGRTLDQARWDSLLDPALLSVVVVKPTMLPIWGLEQYINFMQENGQSAVEYKVAFWLKVGTPFATLVMLFLAVPFVLGGQRSTSMGQRIFLGSIVGASFFLLSRAMSYIAVVYDLNPLLTTAFPAAMFLMITLLMLRKVR